MNSGKIKNQNGNFSYYDMDIQYEKNIYERLIAIKSFGGELLDYKLRTMLFIVVLCSLRKKMVLRFQLLIMNTG